MLALPQTTRRQAIREWQYGQNRSRIQEREIHPEWDEEKKSAEAKAQRIRQEDIIQLEHDRKQVMVKADWAIAEKGNNPKGTIYQPPVKKKLSMDHEFEPIKPDGNLGWKDNLGRSDKTDELIHAIERFIDDWENKTKANSLAPWKTIEGSTKVDFTDEEKMAQWLSGFKEATNYARRHGQH